MAKIKDKMILAIVIIIAIALIIIIITCTIITNKNRWRTMGDTSKYIFNGKLQIIDLAYGDNNYNKCNFKAYNPSILTLNNNNSNAIIIAERISNYTGCDNLTKLSTTKFKNIESFITLTVIEKDKATTKLIELENKAAKNCPKGFEDPRILISPNRLELYVFCNARSVKNCLSEMWLLKFLIGDVISFQLNDDIKPIAMIKLSTPISKGKNEKNWMPFFKGENLYFIYSIQPHIVLSCNTNTGICNMIAKTSNQLISHKLRGGSQIYPLKLLDGKFYLIGAIHERKSNVSYVTRFYAFNFEMPHEIIMMSNEFVFDDSKEETLTSIQFAAGLDFVMDGENLLEAKVSYGEHDCRSKICIIDGREFISALKYLK